MLEKKRRQKGKLKEKVKAKQEKEQEKAKVKMMAESDCGLNEGNHKDMKRREKAAKKEIRQAATERLREWEYMKARGQRISIKDYDSDEEEEYERGQLVGVCPLNVSAPCRAPCPGKAKKNGSSRGKGGKRSMKGQRRKFTDPSALAAKLVIGFV